MGDFAQMRQALEAGVIDAYVSERPEALTAEAANSKFKMVQVEPGFKTGKKIQLSPLDFVKMTTVLAKSMPALKPFQRRPSCLDGSYDQGTTCRSYNN